MAITDRIPAGYDSGFTAVAAGVYTVSAGVATWQSAAGFGIAPVKTIDGIWSVTVGELENYMGAIVTVQATYAFGGPMSCAGTAIDKNTITVSTVGILGEGYVDPLRLSIIVYDYQG